MKLQRMDMVEDNYSESSVMSYNDEGVYVEWTPELQDAWDKQQEREVIYLETDSVYRCMCPNCEVKQTWHKSKYCGNCGQKLAW